MDSIVKDQKWMKKGDFLGFTINDLNFLYMGNITFKKKKNSVSGFMMSHKLNLLF